MTTTLQQSGWLESVSSASARPVELAILAATLEYTEELYSSGKATLTSD